MIIDATDLEPRPADDYLAFPVTSPKTNALPLSAYDRWSGLHFSLLLPPTHCDQFGCRFDTLPHAQ